MLQTLSNLGKMRLASAIFRRRLAYRSPDTHIVLMSVGGHTREVSNLVPLTLRADAGFFQKDFE
jgi:hypothetical protein